ncbi:pyridoxal phosphate-dependent decarboxylase family protein [Hyphomicrobium sp.]|uniref:pyridoxal phosphate-dependent decarboxylase family protein n=1 Tax=Hyphomicrobium sp. TaxID=82 RepID=UPI002D78BD43|nr:aminotransferase class V-fold PLP-dependent enzyme [Hyphomicrobium sp.]HET6388082.1 aminotransferase class V-fold PLP-dependent enzyme [Hyphomicrobium sp.]
MTSRPFEHSASDAGGGGTAAAARDLDPADWAEFRQLAHAALDDVITHIQTVREGPVWQAPPEETRQRFRRQLPVTPSSLADVLDDVRAHVAPFATGNLHPRFMGWAHGAGTPAGMVADMIAAGLNMNCGGRDHIGLEVERQIVRWMAEAFSYPDGASGLFLTGSSMANFLAVIIAKTNAVGPQSRELGLRAADRQLVAYTSAEAHACIAQAMQLSGIGSHHLRQVATDPAGRMDPGALQAAIAADRAAGFQPFLVVATAGTVNTGAVDPLADIAVIAQQEDLWFHVDGAIGALSVLSPVLKPLMAGIEMSHSIALDFHKWGHVPYDAGFLLVRDGAAHKRAFASAAAYLQRADRGLAAGETWPCDLGPDLSRGFRALKTWMTFETLGTARLGDAMLHTCELAQYLAQKVDASETFELKAPVALNIVCFGVKGAAGAANRDLVLDLHESGIAAPSWTTINGDTAIRCAIFNHRTTRRDIDIFMDAISDRALRT